VTEQTPLWATDTPLIVIDGPGRTTIRLLLTDALEFGRSGPGILFDDPAVSRRHLELRPSGSAVLARDLGSANGTTIDGVSLEETQELLPGQVLRLGDITIRLDGSRMFSREGAKELSGTSATPMTAIERVADLVVNRGTAANGVPLGGHTRTIVFSDIEGSTDLAVALGDIAWFDLLSVHNEILRSCLPAHDGTEVKSQGDGFMLTFPSARRAVAYMVEMQRRLHDDERMQSNGLSVRIGAHTGESVEDNDGDLFGQAVIAAARVGAAANGGEILVSSLVREIVKSWDEVVFGESRSEVLKGLGGEWTLHPVLWRDQEPAQ
jgi:adenylate cyclase